MKLRETFSRRHWWLYMFIGAFGAVSCWTTIPAMAQWPTQTSQTWYWCDPANTYYPNIARCPVPWRVINPTGASLPSSNSLAEQAADAQRRAEAARVAIQAQEEATQAEAARLEAQRKRTLAIAQTTAETSPNNICRESQTARKLLDSFNELDWPLPRQAIDIEHLVTVHADNETMSCHGTFVIKDGQRLEGTLAFRLNVAGDPIVQWKQGSWQPSIPQAPPQTVPTSLLPVSSSSGFHDGVTDREGWEAWFNGLSGDERTGALYWANQRSLSHPGRCTALEGTQKIGCQEAQVRLNPTDTRRKTEVDYHAGWNSIVAAGQ